MNYWLTISTLAGMVLSWIIADLFKAEGKTKAVFVLIAGIIVSIIIKVITGDDTIAMLALTTICGSGTIDGLAKWKEKLNK